HPHRDGHRRQPAHGGGHRPGGRSRRLPGGGDARGEAGPHQGRAGRREARRDDRRRDERRSRARPGRRGRGDEHRDDRGEGSRQHGRPRLQPDQAHRHRRDRQADADDARFADDLLDRQRRGEVLRYHPRAVHRDVSPAEVAEHHGPAQLADGGALRGDLQRARDHRADPAGAARRAVPPVGGGGHPAAQRVYLRGRRARRAVHLHQGDRPHPYRDRSLLMIGNLHLRQAVGVTIFFFVLLGLLYPLAETGIGQAFFNHNANGSLTANGSTLVGQQWKGPQWFQGRPDGDDPMATGGSNLGPRSKELVKDVKDQATKLEKEGITPTQDLITTSGSGVDPDISPADAYAQVNAVAHARGLSAATVHQLVANHVQQRELGFLGSSYVNVLELNESLAALK